MGKQVYLAVGHGIRPNGTFDPGARGADGRYEHHEATEVAAECAEALTRCGVTFDHEVSGTQGPEDPNYSGTITNVNKGDYELCVEIHFDWSKAPEGGFGHWYSNNGKLIADCVMAAWKKRDLVARDNWHKQRSDLSFLKYTNPPAMLWECGRIRDFPRRENEKMGEAIAEGIVAFLGMKWVPASTKKHYAVATIGVGDVDDILAYLIGKQHGFKNFKPHELSDVSVGYLVKVGGRASRYFEKYRGIEVRGATRYETAQNALAKIMSKPTSRTRPW